MEPIIYNIIENKEPAMLEEISSVKFFIGELLNNIYKINSNERYGNWWQTISAVTGILYLKGNDIKLRKLLDKTLGKNHCVDAIVKPDFEYYINKHK